ncbi:hypothetical protein D3C87_190580 [compost metagenome]
MKVSSKRILQYALFIFLISAGGCASHKANSHSSAVSFEYDNGQVKERNLIVEGVPVFWGHQIIGADLARQFMLNLKTQKTEVAIVDSGFGDAESVKTKPEPVAFHGRATTSLIKHAAYGVAGVVDVKFQHTYESGAGFQQFLRKIRKDRVDLLQMAMSEMDAQAPLDLELIKTTKSTPTIIAAGNAENSVVSKADRATKAILVGCMARDESVCAYSRSAKFEKGLSGVLILAPGEPGVITDFIDPGTPFGATSAAAAMTAGAIANVISILGPLTPEQAHEILKRTAIPLASSPNGENRGHGYGLLNAYKLVRVAARVQTHMEQELHSKSAKDRQKLLLATLRNSHTYDFDEEARRTLEEAKAVFFEKSSKNPLDPRTARAFNLARVSFFLNPNQESKEFLNNMQTLVTQL